jgi:hypothetical protein
MSDEFGLLVPQGSKSSRKYVCKFCYKSFSVRGGLKYHLYKKKEPCSPFAPAARYARGEIAPDPVRF